MKKSTSAVSLVLIGSSMGLIGCSPNAIPANPQQAQAWQPREGQQGGDWKTPDEQQDEQVAQDQQAQQQQQQSRGPMGGGFIAGRAIGALGARAAAGSRSTPGAGASARGGFGRTGGFGAGS